MIKMGKTGMGGLWNSKEEKKSPENKSKNKDI